MVNFEHKQRLGLGIVLKKINAPLHTVKGLSNALLICHEFSYLFLVVHSGLGFHVLVDGVDHLFVRNLFEEKHA